MYAKSPQFLYKQSRWRLEAVRATRWTLLGVSDLFSVRRWPGFPKTILDFVRPAMLRFRKPLWRINPCPEQNLAQLTSGLSWIDGGR